MCSINAQGCSLQLKIMTRQIGERRLSAEAVFSADFWAKIQK